MKILLTGHKGFIGSHLLELINNSEIITYDLVDGYDLCDSSITKSLPDCDIVIHLAASNGTRLFYETPTDVSFNNTLPVFNLVDRYKKSNTKFVFSSTCEIFNSTTDNNLYNIPTDENVPVMFDDILNPRWSYSIPKALGENLIANSGLPWLILRYFNVYGPRQKDHFISEFVSRVLQGNYYIKGDDTRSFCYVRDAVNITDVLIKTCQNETVNVGNPTENKISDVARIILDIMEIDPNKLEIIDGAKGSAKRRCPDVSKMLQLTDYSYQFDLRTGLQLTVESML